MRALVGMVVLCGCVGPRGSGDVRTWLLYIREVPVAHVVVDSASTGNVVDVSVQGDTAAVPLRHGQGGQASLLPVPGARPPGLKLAFKEDLGGKLGRLLSERQYDDIQRALDGTPSTSRDDLSLGVVRPALDEALHQAAGDERGRRLLDRSGVTPPGFARTIDLRFDPTSTNPLQHADRAALEVWLRDARAGAYAAALQGVDRIRIQNAQGTFLFEAPFK